MISSLSSHHGKKTVCLVFMLGLVYQTVFARAVSNLQVENKARVDSLLAATSKQIPADVLADWRLRDKVDTVGTRKAAADIISSLPAEYSAGLLARLNSLASEPDNSASLQALYQEACTIKRAIRMAPYLHLFKQVVFPEHQRIGSSSVFFQASNSLLSDQGNPRGIYRYQGRVNGSSALYIISMQGVFGAVDKVLEAGKNSSIRDPDVSWDGKRILFAWKKSGDDFHLFEMDAATREIRQITSGVGDADFEGVYLPNGDIVFQSTRVRQPTDCSQTPVENLYLCDKDGRFIRRVGFDQVSTFYPVVLNDGRVVYSRWEYNDRVHSSMHSLFVMYPDGTGQQEYYGNSSFWPINILHTRPIPGSHKVMTISCGYHQPQSGKVFIMDNTVGLQEGAGMTQIAAAVPDDHSLDFRTAPWSEKSAYDGWGTRGHQWAYPLPLTEQAFLSAFMPIDTNNLGIYFFLSQGTEKDRELLYSSGSNCGRPVVLAPRERPLIIPSTVDYTRDYGIVTMEDVYIGEGMVGVPRGTIKKLRVIALEYRTGYVGSGSQGREAASVSSASFLTPIGVKGASWEVKKIIGDAPVYEDGSASFKVPAREPIYFQVLDSQGELVQTMRSWSTLQPGETFSCVGCHESKLEAVPITGLTTAHQTGPVELTPFYGPPRGFSFAKEVQPFLNQKCVSCHGAGGIEPDLTSTPVPNDKHKKSYNQAYLSLVKYVKWYQAESQNPVLPPYFAGSSQSRLIKLLKQGHYDTALTKEEMDKLCAWIDVCVPFSGDYLEGVTDAAEIDKWNATTEWHNQGVALDDQNIRAYLEYLGNPISINGKQVKHDLPGSQLRLVAPGGNTVVLAVTGPAKAVNVYNLKGKRVQQQPVLASGIPVYLNRQSERYLEPGVYIIKALDKNGSNVGSMKVCIAPDH